MRLRIGDVVGAVTTHVENHDSAFKWHLCVCDKQGLHLFVNERQYPDDFPITNLECDGLNNSISYVSLRKPKFRMGFPDSSPRACSLSRAVLRRLYDHIVPSNVMSDVHKAMILPSLVRAI